VINGDNPNQGEPPGGPGSNFDTCLGGSGVNQIFNCEAGDPSTPLPPQGPAQSG
jgi:hypothetical protein